MTAAMFVAPTFAFAYTVSGVVDFTYTSNQIKVGGNTSSSQTFNEHYEVNTAGFIYDPRFLRLNAGVGYNRTHSNNSTDYNSLNYNVRASFFPGRMFSWDLYAAQSTMTIQSNSSLSGYDVDATTYGASFRLSLSKIRPRAGNNNVNNSGNNNNNNGDNNSNNNQEGRRRWSSLSYPDIIFSRNHAESESKSLQNPLHETRDNTSGTIFYRINSTFDLRVNGNVEDYRNLRNSSSYENKSADLLAITKISSNAELKIIGNRIERNVHDMQGFGNEKNFNTRYGMVLDFREQNRIAHSYGYDYDKTKTLGGEFSSQGGFGYIKYALLPELSLFGRLNYSESEFVHSATPLSPYEASSMKSGGLAAGANYKKVYTPAFLEPFVLTSTYDFSTGFTKMSNSTEGDLGGGIYYQNSVSLGLQSSGWKYEVAGFDASFVSRRDNSPMNNDSAAQSYRVWANTKRVPRTDIGASLGYRVQQSSASSAAGPYLSTTAGLNQSTRSLDYAASVDHTLNQYVSLSTGASQGKSTSNNGYTLSTLTSSTDETITMLYAQASFNYSFTRDLRFTASLREEERRSDRQADTASHLASMAINYRLRAITLSTDWRWREDMTDNIPKTVQQSLMVRVSRPF